MSKISGLPPLPDNEVNGDETVPVLKNGMTRRAALGALAAPVILQAETARGAALAASGPIYQSVAEGEQPTPVGQIFLVAAGGALSAHRRVGAGSIELFSYATTTALSGPTGGEKVGFSQSGLGAVDREMLGKGRETVSITDFGAVPNAIFINNGAFAAARAYIAATGAKLRFPPGIYLITESPNWAITNAVIYADGDVTIRCTATANSAVVIDGDAPDAVGVGSEGVYNVTMTGFKVENEQYGNYPALIRAAHQSNIRLHVRGGNPAKDGIHIEFCVSTDFWLACHALDTGTWWQNGIPLRGIYLTHNGDPSKPVSYCNFHNVQVAGPTIGMYQHAALGCSLFGGALQGCSDAGLYLAVGAVNGKIIGTDLEQNAGGDVVVIGANNEFSGVDTQTLFHIIAGANNRINGGTHSSITIDPGSVGNSIEGVRFARPNPDGSPSHGVITDNGTRTRRANNLNMATQKFANVGLTEAAQAVGASPFIYVNNSANSVSLLVTGGTVTTIDYAPQNVVGRLTGQTGGLFRLRPGDALIVTFTAAPEVYLYED